MARDELPDSSRRSFFVRALTGVAGGWVALTGAGAVSSLIAACSRKGESGTGKTDRPLPVDKYGGPPMRRDAPPPVAAKYGGPPPPKYGGPPPPRVTPDAGTHFRPMSARKYGGPRRPSPVDKYGGPRISPDLLGKPRASKYGGPMRYPQAGKYGGPMRFPQASKYGGPIRTTKYGGPIRRRKPIERKPTLKYGGPSTTDL